MRTTDHAMSRIEERLGVVLTRQQAAGAVRSGKKVQRRRGGVRLVRADVRGIDSVFVVDRYGTIMTAYKTPWWVIRKGLK